MSIITLLQRLHQQIACLCKTTEENECFRAAECSKVSTSLTKQFTCECIYTVCQSITLTCSNTNIIRCDILWFHVAKQRRLITCFEELTCCAGNTCSRAVSLKTTLAAATTRTTVRTNYHVTKLTSETIATIYHLTIDYNTRTNTSTKSDVDEVCHTASNTVCHFTNSCSISIIGKSNRQIIQTLTEHLCQWHNTIVTPTKVRSIFNSTIIEIAVRSTNTHSLNLAQATYLINDWLQGINSSINIIIYRVITLSLYSCRCLNIATTINNTKYGVSSAKIQANNIWLQNLFFHVFYKFIC